MDNLRVYIKRQTQEFRKLSEYFCQYAVISKEK
jgi:hypothetical protein